MHPHKDNDLPDIHRYITTHSTDGEAVFLSHAQVPDYMPSQPAGDDGEIALLYATTNFPTSVEDEADVAMYDEFLHQPPGLTTESGTVFRMIDLRPGKMTPMHRTVSLDYGVVLEGDVDLILDSGASRHLHRGDVCIQRGTAHSFKNRSTSEWCRMLFVFLPMQKLTVKGRVLGEEIYDESYEKPEDEELTPYDPTTAPEFSAPGSNSGFGIAQIHRSRGFPADNMRELADPHKTLVPLADTKGPSCRVLALPPAEHGWMHRTLSLDYFVVLSGTVALITDGGAEKILKPHDVVVCRGTNHEWVNRGKDIARLFAVIIPSKEIVTEDGLRLEKTSAGPLYDPPEN